MVLSASMCIYNTTADLVLMHSEPHQRKLEEDIRKIGRQDFQSQEILIELEEIESQVYREILKKSDRLWSPAPMPNYLIGPI